VSQGAWLVESLPVSYPEAFAIDYERWAADMTEDVPFYVELAREADGPVVELAVGTGRVAIPVARAIGRTVIGIDSSPAMLAQARESGGALLDLRLGDMRELELEEPAALVYCPYRALLHLPTWGDRRLVFERVASALLPGGRFAWNAFAFDHSIAARLDGSRQEEPIPHTLRYAVGENRIDIALDTGDTSSLWWATKNEWLGLIDVSGLEVEALYGWFDRRPFDDESREFVWVARKPDA
jgi:SAM-dependent methyltransferase